MYWKKWFAAILTLWLMACPGPGDREDGGSGGAGGGTGEGTGGGNGQPWTFLVYMVADNDLEPFALLDLTEMATVGSGHGVNLIVQVDRSADYSTDPVLNIDDWTSTRRFMVNQGSFTQLSDLGELDMASPSALTDFIKWGLQTYPADKTALILWDHGGGSLFGFGVDEGSQSDTMGVASIQKGISDGLTLAGKTKFDLIGFDACLMATFEVAEALKNLGSYLVASEESEPGHGWDYRTLAQVNRSTTAAALGQTIADGFKSQAQETTWHDDANITLSVIDLSRLGPLETALATLAATYPNGAAVAPVVSSIGQGLNNAIKFAENPDAARSYNLVDLRDFFSKATGVQGAAAIRAAVDQPNGAVIYQVTGGATAGAGGLSIYFPPSPAYYDNEYTTLASLTGVKGVAEWSSFVTAYFGGGAAGGTPIFAASNIDELSETRLTLSGTLTSPAVIADAFMVYGLRLSDLATGLTHTVLLGENEASLSGTTVSGSWDWSVLVLEQGAYSEFGYLALRKLNATQVVAAIPLVYELPGGQRQEAIRTVVYHLGDKTTVSDRTYLYSAGGALGELTPQAGSKLRAKVALLSDYTSFTPEWTLFRETGSGFDATQDISIAFGTITPGAEVYGGLRVQNAAHEGSYVFTEPPVTHP